VDVGLGKIHAGDVRSILMQRDRQVAGGVAPPHGLVLWEVGYPVGTPLDRPRRAAAAFAPPSGDLIDPSGPILRPQLP